MKTKIYSGSVRLLGKDKQKKVLENMALVADALEKDCYPYGIPKGSSSAHVIYNLSENDALPSSYIVNFFQEKDPDEANTSRGYQRFFSDDLTDFIEPSRASG